MTHDEAIKALQALNEAIEARLTHMIAVDVYQDGVCKDSECKWHHEVAEEDDIVRCRNCGHVIS